MSEAMTSAKRTGLSVRRAAPVSGATAFSDEARAMLHGQQRGAAKPTIQEFEVAERAPFEVAVTHQRTEGQPLWVDEVPGPAEKQFGFSV